MADTRTDDRDSTTPSPPIMRDPFTGTTPTGPIMTGSPKGGRGNWGVAARWFIFAILAILFGWGLTFIL